MVCADDIVMFPDIEDSLQEQISLVYKWRLLVNIDKSKVILFKQRQLTCTAYRFMYGEFELDKVTHYKYLGLIFNEFFH